MLKKAIYFISLQLIAFPILAEKISSASIESSVNNCLEINCRANEVTIELQRPATDTQAWLKKSTDSLLKPITIKATESHNFNPQLALKNEEPEIKDLGYITTKELRQRCTMILHEMLDLDNEHKYAVNYDGSQLIYYGFSLKSSLEEKPSNIKKMGNYILTSTKPNHYETPNKLAELIPCILDNIMVNHKSLVEANHIYMKDNKIVFSH